MTLNRVMAVVLVNFSELGRFEGYGYVKMAKVGTPKCNSKNLIFGIRGLSSIVKFVEITEKQYDKERYFPLESENSSCAAYSAAISAIAELLFAIFI